jgi:hypothetical protein
MDDTRAWLASAISEHADFLASGLGQWIEAASIGAGAPPARRDPAGNALVHLVDWLDTGKPDCVLAGRRWLAEMCGPAAPLSERLASVACSALVELLREAGLWDGASPELRRNARILLERFFREPASTDAAHGLPLPSRYERDSDPVPESAPRALEGWGDSPRSGGRPAPGIEPQEKVR